MSLTLVFFFTLVAVLGLIPAFIASKKGRDPVAWWFYGTALFVVALIHAMLLNPTPESKVQAQLDAGMKKCPYCAEIVKGEAIRCKHCRSNLELRAATPTEGT